MYSASPKRRWWRALRASVWIMVGLCAIGLSPRPSGAQSANPGAEPALQLDRAVAIAHAIVAIRARARREDEAQIAPVLEALDGLREALRQYSAELETPGAAAEGDTFRRGSSWVGEPGDAPLPDGLVAERREAGRRGAQQALQALRERRQSLAIQLAEREGVSESAGAKRSAAEPGLPAAPRIHPEVVERLEAEADALLAAPSSGADGPHHAQQVHHLLQRLEAPPPPPPPRNLQPTDVFERLGSRANRTGGQ